MKIWLTTLVLALYAGLFSLPAKAGDFYWVGYQYSQGSFYPDGSYFDEGCWLGYEVPTASDTAYFGYPHDNGNANINNNPHQIHFGNFAFRDGSGNGELFPAGDAELSRLWIVNGQWIFDFGSGAHPGADPPDPLVGSLTAEWAHVYSFDCNPTSLTLRNGVLHLTTPGQWSMVISGTVDCDSPEVTVTGIGAEISAVGDINVGNWLDSHGRIEILDGGVVRARALYGWSAADILVRGAGSHIESLSGTTDGSIVIEDGATAAALTFEGFNLGWWNSPLATATIRGLGSELYVAGGDIEVGGYYGTTELAIGHGRLEVLARGQVTGDYDLAVAQAPGATGLAHISGDGSRLSVGRDAVVGNRGQGELMVELEGKLESGMFAAGYEGGAEGLVTVESGGELLSSLGLIAALPDSQGEVRVRGSSASWRVADSLAVGGEVFGFPRQSLSGGVGTLSLESGGTVDIGRWLGVCTTGSIDLREGGRLVVGSVDEDAVESGTMLMADDAVLVIHARKDGSLLNGVIHADRVGLAGTLKVVLEGNPLAEGDTFSLFDATDFEGMFATWDLPILEGGLTWDVSSVDVDGTLTVVASNGLLGIQRVDTTGDHGSQGTVGIPLNTDGIPTTDPRLRVDGFHVAFQVLVEPADGILGPDDVIITSVSGAVVPPYTVSFPDNGNSGRDLVIQFAQPLPDQQRYRLSFSNLVLLGLAQPLMGDTDVEFRVLQGDANGDGAVTATDVSFVRGRINQTPASGMNGRADVNMTGTITATDVSFVRARIGHSAP